MQELTGGAGVDRVVDAVGIDAQQPKHGPAARAVGRYKDAFAEEVKEVAPETNPDGDTWVPGDAPSLALRWAIQSVAKGGTFGIMGVYPPQLTTFPIGEAMNKNLTVKGGNCNHRRLHPGVARPGPHRRRRSEHCPDPGGTLPSAVEAYRTFDRRESGWTKVLLDLG